MLKWKNRKTKKGKKERRNDQSDRGIEGPSSEIGGEKGWMKKIDRRKVKEGK